MNCKQGEMAIVVRSRTGNEGKVLTCVRYMGYGYINMLGEFVADGIPEWNEHVWETDTIIVLVSGHHGYLMYDSQLRPLRGNLTEDEEEIVKELYTA